MCERACREHEHVCTPKMNKHELPICLQETLLIILSEESTTESDKSVTA